LGGFSGGNLASYYGRGVGTAEVGGAAVGGTGVSCGIGVGRIGVGKTGVAVSNGTGVGRKGVFVGAIVFVGTGDLTGTFIVGRDVDVGIRVNVGILLVEVGESVGVHVGVAVSRRELILSGVYASPGKKSERWSTLVSLGVGTSPYNAVELKPWREKACQPITPNDKKNRTARSTFARKE
jgi:hypothetical protein